MNSSWVTTLFAKFQARYGNKFSSCYPSTEVIKLAIAEWGEGLAGLEGTDVKRGLDSWQGEWPPSLVEFKNACKEHRTKAHEITFALPKPVVDREKVADQLKNMKAALK